MSASADINMNKDYHQQEQRSEIEAHQIEKGVYRAFLAHRLHRVTHALSGPRRARMLYGVGVFHDICTENLAHAKSSEFSPTDIFQLPRALSSNRILSIGTGKGDGVIRSGGYQDITIDQSQGTGQQPTYLQLNAGTNALCMAYTTQ